MNQGHGAGFYRRWAEYAPCLDRMGAAPVVVGTAAHPLQIEWRNLRPPRGTLLPTHLSQIAALQRRTLSQLHAVEDIACYTK